MTLKRLLFWFWSTLLLGAVASLLLGMILQSMLGQFHWLDLLLLGLTFSSVSILGFFCYLVFQWLARGLIRTSRNFRILLFLLLLSAIGYLAFIFHRQFAEKWWAYSILFLMLALSLVVSWLKVRWTNPSAFIPTLFFMVVVTTFESIPSINSKEGQLPIESVFFTILILLICNAWQILQLHRLTEPKGDNPQKKSRKSKK